MMVPIYLWPFPILAITSMWAWRRVEVVAARDRVAGIRLQQRRPRWQIVVDAWLDAAAIPMGASDAVAAWIVVVVGLGAVGVVMSSALLIVGAAVVAVVVPTLVWGRRSRRAIMRAQAIPDLLRSIAAELRCGGTVVTACRTIAATSAPLAGDMETVTRRLGLGATVETAAAMWAAEAGIAAAPSVAAAITVAHDLGGPAADALDGLADSIAGRMEIQHERRAQSAQARMSAWVIMLAPFGYLGFGAAIDQSSIATLFGTSLGRVCCVVALMLDLVAVLWIRLLVGNDARP
jgi:tight adherence protein B